MERSKDRATAFLNSLPRHIKTAPIIEAIVGVNGTDLLDAIFDVDVDPSQLEPLFSNENYFERAQIITQRSDPGRSRSTSVVGNQDGQITPAPTNDSLHVPLPPPSPRVPRSPATTATPGPSGLTVQAESNRLRKRSQTPAVRPVSMGGQLMSFDEEAQMGFQSPLARLFSSAQRKPPRPIDYAPGSVALDEALISIRRLEGMVEGLKEENDKAFGQKLRGDIKELQVCLPDWVRVRC
jgi:hypothetical protein